VGANTPKRPKNPKNPFNPRHEVRLFFLLIGLFVSLNAVPLTFSYFLLI
jgi:hypothetical protein